MWFAGLRALSDWTFRNSVTKVDRGQRAEALAGAVLHRRRVGPEEGRREGRYPAAVDDVVQRQVVPLDAPAPAAAGRRRAEDAEEVPGRVAHVRPTLLQLVQDA